METGVIVAAINAGGDDYIDTNGVTWAADSNFTGGEADFPGKVVAAINSGSSEAYVASDGTTYEADNHYQDGKELAGAYTRLRITEMEGDDAEEETMGAAVIYDYEWKLDPISGNFGEITLDSAQGLRKKSVDRVWSNDRLSYEEIVIIRNAQDEVARKVVTRFEEFPFGFRAVEETIDPEGDALVTSWSYHNPTVVPGDPLPAGYGRLARVIAPDGYWREFTYDEKGRVVKTVRQYQGSTLGDESASQVDTVTYSQTIPQETRVTTIQGQEVRRSYSVESENGDEFERQRIRAVNAGAAWDDATNLVTTTATYRSSHPTALLRGRTKSVEYPDGTMKLYSYSETGDELTKTIEEGAPGPNGTTITDGIRTIQTINATGTIIAEQSIDIDSGLEVSSWQQTSIDELGRVTGISYHDGTTLTRAYSQANGGCGSCSGSSDLIGSETGRDGITTTYTYDALGRRTHMERLGIIEAWQYDPLNNVIEHKRIGTDDSVIVLSSAQYDQASRPTSIFDPLNEETIYDYTYPQSGGMLITQTNPDGGTIVRETYPGGQTKEVSGTAINHSKLVKGVWSNGEWTQEIKVGDQGQESEWVKTYTDLAGREIKMEYPDGAFATMAYDAKGQRISKTDPDGVTTLMAYDERGRRTIEAIDLNDNNQIDLDTDRITETVYEVLTAHSTTVERTSTRIYPHDASSTPLTLAVNDRSIDGLQQWQSRFQQTTHTVRTLPSGGDWTITATSPAGAVTTQTYANGRLTRTDLPHGGGVDYTYDPHGRVATQTDDRIGTTTYAYNARDQIVSETRPAPPGDTNPLVASYSFDAMGRTTATTLPDGTITSATYDPRGNMLTQSGSQTYPVTYTYDAQNRMETMTTANAAGSSVTTWQYDSQRGWLARKQYPDGNGTDYLYTDAGRLGQRLWERGVTTTYSYNAAGDRTLVDYSDSTPDVTTTYTRWGSPATITDGIGTRTMAYSSELRPETESHTGLIDRLLTRNYEVSGTGQVPGRPAGIELGSSLDPDEDHTVTYGYDSIGRLATVTDPNRTWTYGYVADSNLLATTTSGSVVQTRTYEPTRNVITQIENKVGSTDISQYDYTVNRIGQRTSRAQSGSAFGTASEDTFTYNPRGEVIGALNDTNATLDFAYEYDAIGNRITSTVEATSSTPIPTGYTVNALNQYIEIDPDGTPLYDPVHDADGNLIDDGKGHQLAWDGENRLIEWKPILPVIGDKRVVNHYDGQSRRIRREVFEWTASGWDKQQDEAWIYDNWNPVAKYTLQPSALTLHTSYTWGQDLSGNMQGAGGVGGLLGTDDGTEQSQFFYDANGNVSEVLNTTGNVIAHYEYDPFGNTTKATGSYANTNLHRFSTKPLEVVNGLYYYGYRFYNPVSGRWLNRDPIAENGGVNLYGFIGNGPTGSIDLLGTHEVDGDKITVHGCEITIAFGHGSARSPIEWEFPWTCSAGGAVTCNPDSNNNMDPQHKVDGLPNHDKNIYTPDKGNALTNNRQDINDLSGIESGQEAFRRALKGAYGKAMEFCNKECCASVAVNTTLRYGGLFSNDNLPSSNFDYGIDCGETTREEYNNAVDEYINGWREEKGLR